MTKNEIKALLNAHLAKNTNDLNEFNLLVNAAQLNKGAINKRILNHLPEGCSYRIQYGMYSVIFPSGNDHLLGWVNSTSELTNEGLRHSDSCHSNGSENRIAQLTNILKDENFDKFAKLFINLHKSVQSVISAMNEIESNKQDSFYNPIYYNLLEMAGISQNAWFEIEKIKRSVKK